MVVYDELQRTNDLIQSQVDIVPYPETTTNLSQLTIDQVYQIRLAPYNFWGRGPLTVPYDVYVGEAGKDWLNPARQLVYPSPSQTKI